jgi:MFS family permease
MENKSTFNRWWVVFGAILIQLSLGAIYIYSVFKPALKERFPDWSDTDLALPSQLVLAFFAISMIFAGRIQDKLGPRLIATFGGIFLGIGLLIASFATSLTMFVIGFSIIGGIGVGTAYVCPIATCVKWFPDKKRIDHRVGSGRFWSRRAVIYSCSQITDLQSGYHDNLHVPGDHFLYSCSDRSTIYEGTSSRIQARRMESTGADRCRTKFKSGLFYI